MDRQRIILPINLFTAIPTTSTASTFIRFAQSAVRLTIVPHAVQIITEKE